MEVKLSPAEEREARRSVWMTRGRKALIGFNATFGIFLALLIWAMVNYLALRHHHRIDASAGQLYALSPKTTQLLSALEHPVRVTVFFQPDHSVFNHIKNLLTEYTSLSRLLRVEFVDPVRDQARAKEVGLLYRLEAPNQVVFEHEGRVHIVDANRLATWSEPTDPHGAERPTMTQFAGEQEFTAAILSVTGAKKSRVYFLTGHGERDPTDFDNQRGYSHAGRYLERENLEVLPLELTSSTGIPADCDVLVIAGPTQRISPGEVDFVRAYLERGGRLLALLDAVAVSGLEDLMEEWGVRLRNDIILDPRKTLTGREVIVTQYADHPVTQRMDKLITMFFLPRSITPAEKKSPANRPVDLPRMTQLASCSPFGWSERDMETQPSRFDESVDERGPICLAAAIERGPVNNVASVKPTRLVVIGDSQFAANGAKSGGSMALFINSVNWLLSREQLIEIPPKPVDEMRLVLTSRDSSDLFVALVIFIPGLVGMMGLAVWWRRSR